MLKAAPTRFPLIKTTRRLDQSKWSLARHSEGFVHPEKGNNHPQTAYKSTRSTDQLARKFNLHEKGTQPAANATARHVAHDAIIYFYSNKTYLHTLLC
jgi:hypothetical protein